MGAPERSVQNRQEKETKETKETMVDVKDFFAGARRVASHEVPAPEPERDPQGENRLLAMTGLPFRCGVCGRTHRVSGQGNGSTVKCIEQIVKVFGLKSRSGHHVYYRDSYAVAFLPDIGDPGTIQEIKFRRSCAVSVNGLTDHATNLHILEVLYPSLHREVVDVDARLGQRQAITETVQIREALAEHDTLGWLRGRLDGFRDRAAREHEALLVAAKRDTQDLRGRLERLPATPPGRFHVTPLGPDKCLDGWIGARSVPFERTIGTLKVNDHELRSTELLQWFRHAGDFWPSVAGPRVDARERVLLDVNIVNGFPAIMWAAVVGRYQDQDHSIYRGVSATVYVTTWDGRVYLRRSYGNSTSYTIKDFVGSPSRYAQLVLGDQDRNG